jgi:ribose transport system substrate-binding protein
VFFRSVEAVWNLISDEQKEAVRNGGYTAAISLHTTNADWSLLQLQGIQVVLDEFNIELVASTDAEMKPDKQVSDIESIIGLKPDLLISFVLDNDSLAPILKKVSDAGILISFIDSVPTGFQNPQDYIGMGAADNYANGVASAQALADYLDGKGKIACIDFVTSLFHTDQRSAGAREVFAKYPDIEIVAEQQSDSAESAATITESILIAHPDLVGMWVFWDGPGMGAVGAIEQMGKDVKVTTVDLSEDTAYSIASGGAMLAAGAQHPYDQGVAEAILGVAGLAGVKDIPPYVVVPGEIVTKESMAKSWERVFKIPVPADMAAMLK